MPTIPKKVEDRLVAGVKRFQPVLSTAKTRDLNESDTVVILTDMLQEVFGYDKYSEVTSEFSIRSTYCDLAIKLNGKAQVLLEAKAVGTELKDNHVKQAVDYAANQGVEWVILTNGAHWRIYRVVFGRPIDQELVCSFDFLALNPKQGEHLLHLFLLTKEGWAKSAVGEFHEQKQALSRFSLGAVLLSEPVLSVMRRELRRISPDVKIETEQIRGVLQQEVIKRDVLEGPKFAEAQRVVNRIAARAQRATHAPIPTDSLAPRSEPTPPSATASHPA